jgi:hypothetical protein
MACAMLTVAFAIRRLAFGFEFERRGALGESVPAVCTASRYSYIGSVPPGADVGTVQSRRRCGLSVVSRWYGKAQPEVGESRSRCE